MLFEKPLFFSRSRGGRSAGRPRRLAGPGRRHGNPRSPDPRHRVGFGRHHGGRGHAVRPAGRPHGGRARGRGHQAGTPLLGGPDGDQRGRRRHPHRERPKREGPAHRRPGPLLHDRLQLGLPGRRHGPGPRHPRDQQARGGGLRLQQGQQRRGDLHHRGRPGEHRGHRGAGRHRPGLRELPRTPKKHGEADLLLRTGRRGPDGGPEALRQQRGRRRAPAQLDRGHGGRRHLGLLGPAHEQLRPRVGLPEPAHHRARRRHRGGGPGLLPR